MSLLLMPINNIIPVDVSVIGYKYNILMVQFPGAALLWTF